jgi:hypothetical protein
MHCQDKTSKRLTYGRETRGRETRGSVRERETLVYWIQDKEGNEIQFKRNAAQKKFDNDQWYRDVIVKARQLGFSTEIELFILDDCLFRRNTAAAIIDDTLGDAKKKLAKIKFAYDRLPKIVRALVPLRNVNTEEIRFSNGSEVSIGTTFRGDPRNSCTSLYAEQGPDDMKSEFPSCIEECFYASLEGSFFKREMSRARDDKRIGRPLPYDPSRPVNTFWDIGMDDENCIWFHQTDGVRHRLIDFYMNSGEGLPHYVQVLEAKNALGGTGQLTGSTGRIDISGEPASAVLMSGRTSTGARR